MRFHSVTDVYIFHKELGLEVEYGKFKSRDFKPTEEQLSSLKAIREKSKYKLKPSMSFGFSMFKSNVADKPFIKEIIQSLLTNNNLKLAKAVSSFKTHMMIEYDFYHTELDENSFQSFCEYSLRHLERTLHKLMFGGGINIREASLILSLVPIEMVKNNYCAVHKIDDKSLFDVMYSKSEEDLQGKIFEGCLSEGQILASIINSDLFDFKT